MLAMSKSPFEDALNRPITRRRLLSASARAAAASLAASLMPVNVRRALAQPVRTGQLSDIKHVVLLMQENRSFDHYFGTMAGVRGFDDPDALRLPNGHSVFYQPDAENPDGYMLPFHLDTRTTNAQKIPSTSHAWSVQHEAWNGGKMDQWLPAHRKADGANGALRDGLPYARRHSVSVRAGRGVHHLRRVRTARCSDRRGRIGCIG